MDSEAQTICLPSQSFFRAKIFRIENEIVKVVHPDGQSYIAYNVEENEKHGEGKLTGVKSGEELEVHLKLHISDYDLVRGETKVDQLLLSNDWGLGPVSPHYKYIGTLAGLCNLTDFRYGRWPHEEARFGFLMRVPFPVYADIWVRKGSEIRDGAAIKGFNAHFEIESGESYRRDSRFRIVESPPNLRVPPEWESISK